MPLPKWTHNQTYVKSKTFQEPYKGEVQIWVHNCQNDSLFIEYGVLLYNVKGLRIGDGVLQTFYLPSWENVQELWEKWIRKNG